MDLQSWFEERKPESVPGQFIVWFPDGHAEAHERFEIDGAVFELELEDDDDIITKNGRGWEFTHFYEGHLLTTHYGFLMYDSIDTHAYLARFQCLALYEPLGGDVIGVVLLFLAQM